MSVLCTSLNVVCHTSAMFISISCHTLLSIRSPILICVILSKCDVRFRTCKEYIVFFHTVLAVLSIETGRTSAAMTPMGIGALSAILTWIVLTLVDVYKLKGQ